MQNTEIKKKYPESISFLLLFFRGKDLGLLRCGLQGSLVCPLGVTLNRNWEACQKNFHSGIVFVLFLGGGGGEGVPGKQQEVRWHQG